MTRPLSAVLRAAPLLVLACLVAVAAGSVETQAPGAIRVLSEEEVPVAPSLALNVRWAGDQSLYLSRLAHGVTEVSLDGKLTALRQPIPDRQALGVRFPMFERLAVSPDYIVVGSLMADLGFRPRAASDTGKYRFTKFRLWAVQGIDMFGDRLLLLGDPRPRSLDESPSKGGVAWIGPLSEHPERDMKPFLYDVAGPATPDRVLPPSLLHCMGLELGAVRFLADGSYLVVPGFQDGVNLYGPGGEFLHRWKNETVGLDAPDCADFDRQQDERFASSYPARFEFLNQRRVLEEILPLPEGPGLLIRSVAGGQVHWSLNVLHGGQVVSYPVPIAGSLPYDRLRADAHGDRIAFLRTWHGFDQGSKSVLRPGRLYVAQFAPGGQEVRR
jgi:hypothetical protein